jgi:hypothetical protein
MLVWRIRSPRAQRPPHSLLCSGQSQNKTPPPPPLLALLLDLIAPSDDPIVPESWGAAGRFPFLSQQSSGAPRTHVQEKGAAGLEAYL